jgi:hypothetical protein
MLLESFKKWGEGFRKVSKIPLENGGKKIYYGVSEILAALLPAVMWKTENVPDRIN